MNKELANFGQAYVRIN